MFNSSKTPMHSSPLPELVSGLVVAVFLMGLLAFGYRRQGYPSLPVEQGSNAAVPSLMFFTLGAGLIIGIVGFAYFLTSRRNRAAAERALTQ